MARDGGRRVARQDAADGARDSRVKPVKQGHLAVTEITFSRPGGPSPFGDEVQFPLPVEDLNYTHVSR
ncbi:hypothetical protein [Polymorphospora rubra]|uniref:Uncharacterized protein n=1 Tax=Polymorphospora rubra TaxID=338584 RepID=A0A810N044_9ACTN|nr:hypothetical protein [Polymorphospora rubra]BCJ65018.1 hypothetical protein Prubr_20390 [Polymorphospora rubra]